MKIAHSATLNVYTLFKLSAVQSVLKRRPIEINGTVIEVDIYEAEPSFDKSVCSSSVVEVTGIEMDNVKMLTELLELYFEDEESSGGDTVVDIKVLDKMALVTFESVEG